MFSVDVQKPDKKQVRKDGRGTLMLLDMLLDVCQSSSRAGDQTLSCHLELHWEDKKKVRFHLHTVA